MGKTSLLLWDNSALGVLEELEKLEVPLLFKLSGRVRGFVFLTLRTWKTSNGNYKDFTCIISSGTFDFISSSFFFFLFFFFLLCLSISCNVLNFSLACLLNTLDLEVG